MPRLTVNAHERSASFADPSSHLGDANLAESVRRSMSDPTYDLRRVVASGGKFDIVGSGG